MTNASWHKNRVIIWLLILILPPVGLILLWLQQNSRIATKIFGSLAAVACGVLHLFLFWGLKMEMDGGMRHATFYFKNPGRHDSEIEKRREQDRSVDTSGPAALPVVAVPAAPSNASAGEAARPEPVTHRAYWTEFRGPDRNGIYSQMEIITEWPSGKLPLLWKRPVGGGYASAVVADGIVFTIEQRRQKEVVAAYALDSGRELWIHGWDAEFRETLGGDGPRATPTWYDGRLYALGATGELRCLDAKSGRYIWSRNILIENQAANLPWGMAASALIVDDKVIVLPGGPAGKSVVAYHRLTGEPIWKVLDDKQAYVSPHMVTLAGRRQLLIIGANRAIGLTPENGSLLWEFPWVTDNDINVAQPIVTAGNRFFISSGYGHGCALIELAQKNDGYAAQMVWQNNRMKNKFSSSVLHEGYIYGLDESILACMDAGTGELKWKGGRYGYGQLLLASDHLIISTEAGEVVLVKASPDKHQEIARFQALQGRTWNVPAIAEGRLIVRNGTEMACYRIQHQPSGKTL